MHATRIALMAAFTGLSTVINVAPASAQQACGEVNCEPGFECQVTALPCSSACYITEDGEKVCETPECPTEPYFYCAAAACETDADCGENMVCHTHESTSCSGAVGRECDDDGNCEQVETETTCTSTEHKQCNYRYELPCESAADCGEGFACVETQECWCTGGPTQDAPDGSSSGSGSDGDAPGEAPNSNDQGGDEEGSAAAPPRDRDVNCGCQPAGVSYCQATEIECVVAADCPSGWTCELGGETCWQDTEGNGGCEQLPSRCYPPHRGEDTGLGGGVVEPGQDDEGYGEDDDVNWSDDGENIDDEPNAEGGSSSGADVRNFWALLGCSVKAAPGGGGSASVLPWILAAFGLTVARRRNSR